MWSYFVVVNGQVLNRASASDIDNTTWTALLGVGALIGSGALLPLAWKTSASAPTVDAPTLIRFVIVCALLATLGSWCASWSWNRAARRLPALLLGQLMALETLFGAAFNLIWEARWPALGEVIGAVAVTAGVLLCLRSLERHGSPSTAPD